MRYDRSCPPQQEHPRSSHTLSCFTEKRFLLQNKSTRYPTTIAMTTLRPKIVRILPPLFGYPNITMIASSDVDINTARSVPTETSRSAYRFAATTENPHCGIHPNSAPMIGPALFPFIRIRSRFSPVYFSTNSISKNAKSKNGIILAPSISTSLQISHTALNAYPP